MTREPLRLVPQSMCTSDFGHVVPDELKDLVEMYHNDLPVPDLCCRVRKLGRYWQCEDKMPDTLQESWKECDPERFRNIAPTVISMILGGITHFALIDPKGGRDEYLNR